MIHQHSHTIRLFITTMIFLLTAGCNDGINECFSGSGKIITKRIGLYEFRNVVVEDNIGLVLKNGVVCGLEITGGEYILPMLDVSIKANTLYLGNGSTCPMFKKPWDEILIILTAPFLDTLVVKSHGSLKSSGTFRSDSFVMIVKESPADVDINIDCTSFQLQYLSGTGNISITGTLERGTVFHSGYGLLDLTGLITRFLNLNTRSSNHSFVRGGEQYMFVVTGGDGNVYYVNDPLKIEWQKEGRGELIRIFQ